MGSSRNQQTDAAALAYGLMARVHSPCPSSQVISQGAVTGTQFLESTGKCL